MLPRADKLGDALGRCETPKQHNGKDDTKWLYVLHVRRSDTVNRCDTRVDSVMHYMRCPAARANETANHTLLIFTDETDHGYINSLRMNLATLPRWGGGVVHGDALVMAELGEEYRTDNYLVYSVASLLMSRADQFFAMERCSGTQGCSNIHPARIQDQRSA